MIYLKDGWNTYRQTENGYGLEKFNAEYGYAVGHTGAINRFNSYAFYFPAEDMTYVLLVNNTGTVHSKDQIFREVIAKMFE